MNIIFFNTVALGDYLVHSKLIKDFKLKYKCQITAVCSPYNSRIIKFHDHIDEIILYDPKWSFYKKFKTLRKIIKKKYYLSIVFDCKKFSMLSNFLLKAKYKRGVLMQKYKMIFSYKFFIFYPIKIIAFFLYDKYVVHKRVKYIDKHYYLPATWIELLSDFKISTSVNDIYYFNNKKINETEKKFLLKKLNIKDYILLHLDHKWEDIKDINFDFYSNLLNLSLTTKKNILLTSYDNKSEYFKFLEKKINVFYAKTFVFLKKNNQNIFLIKDPDIFLQERLISNSSLNISCHSGILVHGSGANKIELIDILNSGEISIQKCWTPLNKYSVILKSTNNSDKINLRSIFNKISKKILKHNFV